MEIQYLPVNQIKPLENNPRRISRDQFQRLCDNILADPDFFSMRPLLVKKNGDSFIVYAGNQRLRAAKKLGWKLVPCIESDSPDEIIKKRTVLDNLHHGEFDDDMLASLYEPNELLELGFLEKDLDFDEQSIEKTPQENEACPTCGKKIKRKKNDSKEM